MKSRTVLSLALLATMLAAASTADAQHRPRVPRFKEQIQVTPSAPLAVPGRESDHRLTFSGPFALPGLSLGAGTYIFRVAERRTIQVLSADASTAYAWLHTIPVSRPGSTAGYEVWFGEPLADGSPRRLTAWFLPQQTSGYELLYATHEARPSGTIAQATK